jgi:hypothetical protein
MPVQSASATLAGNSSVTATANDVDHASTSIVGGSILFLDLSLVTIKSLFKPTQVPAAVRGSSVPTVRTIPAPVTHSFQVGVPGRKPPNTQGGGIPNEG